MWGFGVVEAKSLDKHHHHWTCRVAALQHRLAAWTCVWLYAASQAMGLVSRRIGSRQQSKRVVGAIGGGAAQRCVAVADWVTTSVAMWSGIGFDVSGARKQKGGGSRRWASLG